MASSSAKDVVKALESTFHAQSLQAPATASTALESEPLTEDVQKTIRIFVDKTTTLEDAEAQKLHDALIAIRDKYQFHDQFMLQNQPKQGAFLHVLELLRPVIKRRARLKEWFDRTVSPVLYEAGHRTTELEHARAFTLGILEGDGEDNADSENARLAAETAKALLDAYTERVAVHQKEAGLLTAEDKVVAQQLEDVIIEWGKRRPKSFMLNVDRLIVSKELRLQGLALLCTFARHQPPYLYTISQTPLVEHLLKCLMIDTSTTVISLALTTLIMFLPHIPASVQTHLPRLFLIYSRLLCWERFSPSQVGDGSATEESDFDSEAPMEHENEDSKTPEPRSPEDKEWDKIDSSFEKAESTAPELSHYFTFLYGLYPLNFTSYIRKPRKYLIGINFPRAEEFDLDQTVIRSRSDQFRRMHLLHPNFFHTTEEEELSNNRWLKSDPSDVVSECMGLCITPSSVVSTIASTWFNNQDATSTTYVRTEDIPPQSLLDRDLGSTIVASSSPSTQDLTSSDTWTSQPIIFANRNTPRATEVDNVFFNTSHLAEDTPSTQSPYFGSPATLPRDTVANSPLVPPSIQKTVGAHLQGSRISLTSSSEPSSRLVPPTRDDLPRSPALKPANAAEANAAFLQREAMLLRSELDFERFLKQQHLTHIGQLQRRHIKELTVEAETQNLMNTNRALKAKVTKSNESYAALKKETATSRSQFKKWEAELTNRVKSFKEDEKLLKSELETLKLTLAQSNNDCEQLKQIVTDSESRELSAREELFSIQRKLEAMETMEKKVTELKDELLQYENRQLEFQAAEQSRESMRQELLTTDSLVASKDAALAQAQHSFEGRIRDLEAQLLQAQNPAAGAPPGTIAPHVQAMIDSAVAATEAKYATLLKEHAELKRRAMELEMRGADTKSSSLDKSLSRSNNKLQSSGSAPEGQSMLKKFSLRDVRPSKNKRGELSKLVTTSNTGSTNTNSNGGSPTIDAGLLNEMKNASPTLQDAIDDAFSASASSSPLKKTVSASTVVGTDGRAVPVAVPGSGLHTRFSPGSLPLAGASASPVTVKGGKIASAWSTDSESNSPMDRTGIAKVESGSSVLGKDAEDGKASNGERKGSARRFGFMK